MNDNYRLSKVIFFDNLLGGFFKAENHLSYYFCLYDYEIQYKLIEAYYRYSNKISATNYLFFRFDGRRSELFNDLTTITSQSKLISNEHDFESEVLNGIKCTYKANPKLTKWNISIAEFNSFIRWDTDETRLQWILFDYYEIRIVGLVL